MFLKSVLDGAFTLAGPVYAAMRPVGGKLRGRGERGTVLGTGAQGVAAGDRGSQICRVGRGESTPVVAIDVPACVYTGSI